MLRREEKEEGNECVVDRGMEGGEKKSRTLLAAWMIEIMARAMEAHAGDGCAERERGEREVAGANEWHARQMYWWLLPPFGAGRYFYQSYWMVWFGSWYYREGQALSCAAWLLPTHRDVWGRSLSPAQLS